jgi:hypothetical protein
MIEPTLKVLIGTAFYVGLLWVTQRNPRAAGMMLTFPTLNGLVLLMAGPAALEDAASAMLLMPLINVALWAFYLGFFGHLVDRQIAPAMASGGLIGAGAVGWLVVAALITDRKWGVAVAWQWAYVPGVLAAGIALTLVLPRRAAPLGAATASRALAIVQLLQRHRYRVFVFALTLAAIAVMDRLGASPALLGAVAGAPLVAMFGMQTFVGDGTVTLAARRAALAAMGDGLWLGPAIAITFVAVYWRALAWLAANSGGLVYHLVGAAMLVAGWTACLAAIWIASRLCSPPAVSAGPSGHPSGSP